MSTDTCSVCGVRGGHARNCRIVQPQLYLAKQNRPRLNQLLPALAGLVLTIIAIISILVLLLGGK